MAIILVDFDGTCVPQLPENGFCEVDTGAESVLKELISHGHKIVLWTARNSSRNNPYNYISGRFRNETSLEEAERWFRERDIELYGVNQHNEEESAVGYSRKLIGDFLIDDTSIGAPLSWGTVEYCCYETGELKTTTTHCIDWIVIRDMLKCMKLL